MAKLRRNHQGGGGAAIVRVGLFAAILTGIIGIYNFLTGKADEEPPTSETVVTPMDQSDDRQLYLPTSTTGEVIHHTYYSLSYSEEHEQAEWVAYVLTRDRLEMAWVDRPDRFDSDPQVPSRSADWNDYRGSGYDRGHLVPAADMAFSEEAIQETFLMSNISPQSHDFNKGIWKELEELTRDWARKYKKLYVVTGPVLSKPGKGAIGDNRVTIPSAYYKVLLDLSEPELKGIAFLLPNEISYDPLFKYAVRIDEVEELTGIDFFPELMTSTLEAELEGAFNIDLWEFSKKKFDLRTQKWNQER